MAMQDLLKKVQDKLGKQNEDIILDYNKKLNTISTGSIILDNILGGGLLVEKRISEIFGLESSGKTTICLQSAREALKQGKDVLFMDFEQTYDTNYATSLGIEKDNPHLLVVRPSNLEEGITILREAEKLLGDGAVIIIDSVASAKPKKLLEQAGEQQQIGLHAQRIGEFSAYLQSTWCGQKKAYILLTNQVRRVPSATNMFQAKAFKSSGVGFGSSNDDSFTTTGGNQLRYLCTIRLALDFAGKIETGTFEAGDVERVGNNIKAFVVKNKIAPPFQSAKLAIMYGDGTDDFFALVDTLKEHGYISNTGASYAYIDSNKNDVETGTGLSFKTRGKDAFFSQLKQEQYRNDMQITYKHLMDTTEAIKIIENEDDFVPTID